MTRFRLTIEFDGRPYMGWQRQPHGPTVQAAIEDAAQAITQQDDIIVHGAGRTDAGVHAEAMVAHVDVARDFTPFRLMEALNAKLRPAPIAITDCKTVTDDWHARFSCLGRRYVYRIVNRRAPLALDQGRAWRVTQPLDADAMDKAAQILIGTHDFTTFRSAHCQSESAVKSLDTLRVTRFGSDIEVEAAARSFLHHQVRSMVGCLHLVGLGKWSEADMRRALLAKDRAALGFNAPPDGLYFVGARYPDD
jgi:tRNA pseudouridine38-40 synthase